MSLSYFSKCRYPSLLMIPKFSFLFLKTSIKFYYTEFPLCQNDDIPHQDDNTGPHSMNAGPKLTRTRVTTCHVTETCSNLQKPGFISLTKGYRIVYTSETISIQINEIVYNINQKCRLYANSRWFIPVSANHVPV